PPDHSLSRLAGLGRSTFPRVLPLGRHRNFIAECGEQGAELKIASLSLALTGILGTWAGSAAGQAPPSANLVQNVSRTTKAVNYRRAGGSTKIDFQGTELKVDLGGPSGTAVVHRFGCARNIL